MALRVGTPLGLLLELTRPGTPGGIFPCMSGKAGLEAALLLILPRVKLSKGVGARRTLKADGLVEVGFVADGRRGEG